MAESSYLILRLVFRFSPKRYIANINTAISPWTSPEDRECAFNKINHALSVIEKFSPCRFSELQRDVERIYVGGEPSFKGQYVHTLRLIQVNPEYLSAADTSAEEVASTLVHESQHAKLYLRGFNYDPPIRGRIERLCFLAQRNFARRIPNGERLVEIAEHWLNSDLDNHFSDKALRNSQIEALRKLDCPEWLVRTVEWIVELRSRGKTDA